MSRVVIVGNPARIMENGKQLDDEHIGARLLGEQQPIASHTSPVPHAVYAFEVEHEAAFDLSKKCASQD